MDEPGRMDAVQMSRRGALLMIPALAASGCGVTGEIDAPLSLTGPLRIATGSAQGVYHAWAQALRAELERFYPDLQVTVVTSTGGIENLRRIHAGSASLALATADAVLEALRGYAPFTVAVPVTALARVYDDYVHLMVRADSSLRKLEDISGRRVAVGSAGSGTKLIANRVLAVGRISRVDRLELGLVEGTAALADRSVDAVFWSGGLPTTAVDGAARDIGIRLVPLGQAAGAMRQEHGAAYRPATIPAGVYGRSEPVPTIATANLLIARDDADKAMVRAVLSTVFTSRDRIAHKVPAGNALDRRTAIATQPVPLHPGAEAYYRASKP